MESHPVPHRKQNALLERALDCQSGAPGSRHRPHRPTCELRKASTPLKNRDASAPSTAKVQVSRRAVVCGRGKPTGASSMMNASVNK